MKQIFYLLLLGIVFPFNAISQNLLKGGDMESATSWTQFGEASFSGDKNTQLVWGDLPGDRSQEYKPTGFDTGGFLTVAEGWNGGTQYAIYQTVELKKDIQYLISFDRHIGNYRRAWFEVYVGKAEPTDADYKDNKIGTSLIPWNDGYIGSNNKGVFNENFSVDETGSYYFVIKIGCGWGGGGGEGYFNVSFDNVSLMVTPLTADFSFPNGNFIDYPVQFVNKSVPTDMINSYSWDFGVEGATSTEENPAYTYTEAGTYTVTLTVNGNDALSVSKDITVLAIPVSIETLEGGNMEAADEALWQVAVVDAFKTGGVTWGATVTGFGNGGVLHLEDLNNGSGNTQYYIWQPVHLNEGIAYDLSFDFALGSYLKAWGEVYIGTALPGTGDYSDGGQRQPNPMGWRDIEQNGNRETKKYNYSFTPATTGVFYYVIKVGCNDGGGKFDVAIDNVSLKKEGAAIPSVKPQLVRFVQVADEIQISQVVKDVKIISISGQTVLNKSNAHSINVSALAKGVYILQMVDNQGIQSAHKIVIR